MHHAPCEFHFMLHTGIMLQTMCALCPLVIVPLGGALSRTLGFGIPTAIPVYGGPETHHNTCPAAVDPGTLLLRSQYPSRHPSYGLLYQIFILSYNMHISTWHHHSSLCVIMLFLRWLPTLYQLVLLGSGNIVLLHLICTHPQCPQASNSPVPSCTN